MTREYLANVQRGKHMIDDLAGARGHRQKLLKKSMAAVAHELPQVNPNTLTAWDRAALKKVAEIKQAQEREEYVSALKRVFELAGLNYGIEQQNFWRRYNANQQHRSSKD